MKIYVLTSEYNEYDQFGEYFERAFRDKPTIEELVSIGLPFDNARFCVLEGEGGRLGDEQKWWWLREVKLS